MRSKYLAAVAAASLVFGSSAIASAQTAQAVDRAPAPVAGTNQLDDDGGYTIWIIGAIVLGLLIWGIIELTDDDSPASP